MKGSLPKENRTRRTPSAFLPYQQAWAADDNPVKLMEKGRRIGISWAEAGEDALLAASKNGMDTWYIGYNKEMAQEFVEDAADWAKHYKKAASRVEEFVFNDEDKDIQAFRIRFASGWKLTALSSRPANLRGKQGKIVIDEAAFHDDLAGLLKAAVAMLMWGGRVVVISTHNGDDNPFNELVQDVLAGRKPYSHHRVTLDDALAAGLYRRVCLRLGKTWDAAAEAAWRQHLVDFYGEDADEELFCIPSRGGGVYIPLNLIEAVESDDVPVLRWAPPAKDFVDWADDTRFREVRDWCAAEMAPLLEARTLDRLRSWLGEDFGRSIDLTVMWPVQELAGASYHTPFVLELRDCPFTQQEQALFCLADGLPRFTGAALDKGGNGAFLAERARQRYGVDRVEEVSFTAAWYIENMPRLKAGFEDKTLSTPRDAEIRADFRAIRKIRGVPRVPVDERTADKQGGKRHGDAAIAKALALYAARTFSGGPVEYETTIKRRFGRRGAY